MAELQIPDFTEVAVSLLATIEGRLGEVEEALLQLDVFEALQRAYTEGWNVSRGHGFDLKDGTVVPRPGTCPYPLSDDWSAEHCQQAGNCGCDLKVRLAEIPEDGK